MTLYDPSQNDEISVRFLDLFYILTIFKIRFSIMLIIIYKGV